MSLNRVYSVTQRDGAGYLALYYLTIPWILLLHFFGCDKEPFNPNNYGVYYDYVPNPNGSPYAEVFLFYPLPLSKADEQTKRKVLLCATMA